MRPFDYAEPTTLAEACALLAAREAARPLAGGVALILLLRQRLLAPGLVVNLKHIPGLAEVVWDDRRGLQLGALVRHRTVELDPLVRAHCPVLAEMARHIGSVQMRHRGTLGGNLCHADPAQDPPTVLTALDATVTLVDAQGERTLPVAEFVVGYYETALRPGELLRAVHVPPLPPRAGAAYARWSPRGATDMPLLGVAAVLAVDRDGVCTDARLAVGNCAERPLRLTAVETALRGERLDAARLERISALIPDHLDPPSDIRGSGEYRRRMARVFGARALHAALLRARAAANGAGAS